MFNKKLYARIVESCLLLNLLSAYDMLLFIYKANFKYFTCSELSISFIREVELTLDGIKDIDLEIVRKTKIKELMEDIKRDEEILSGNN